MQGKIMKFNNTFGNSRNILSGNCTELKNALFEEVAKQLGVEHKAYSPVYRPQANGMIEGFYKFLKECISKHLVQSLEWDDVLPLAAVAYNWFPNEHSLHSSLCLGEMQQQILPSSSNINRDTWVL